MKNAFLSGWFARSRFLRPLLQKSLLLAIRPPSRALHRPTATPLRSIRLLRTCKRSDDAPTRCIHLFQSIFPLVFLLFPLETRFLPATFVKMFLFNHSYLPLVVIYLFNIYFQSTSSMVASLVSIDLSIERMECSYYRSLMERSLAGRHRKDSSLGSYPISTSHASSTILTPRVS